MKRESEWMKLGGGREKEGWEEKGRGGRGRERGGRGGLIS